MFIKSTNTITDIALTVPNIIGGDNSKVVRISGANTAVNALNTDSAIQLNSVLFKQGGIYYASGLITGLTGLSPGAPYFLAGDGSLTSSPPTPTSLVRTLYIGFAVNTTDLIFKPGTPISGT